MNILTLDVETTVFNKGNPFDLRNKCVMVGLKFQGEVAQTFLLGEFNWVNLIQKYIDKADLIVGFNLKFDLHWLRNIGISFEDKKIYDCQLGEFLLSNQEHKYPSLNSCLEKYELTLKLDVVKTEYWDKGIDTDAIPVEILEEYLVGDLEATEEVYKIQTNELVKAGLYPLFKLQCLDLLVLEEMEYQGIKFNTTRAKQKADEISEELSNLVSDITSYSNGVPFNLNSDDHISALLYGGTITEDTRIPIGVYKTGAKVGETRYKIITKEYLLPRLIEPLKGTERVKEGYWLTNDDVMRSLKPNKDAKILLQKLKKYATLEKLKGTYLIGWSNLIDEMNWEKDMIHGTINQCTVITGRTSSTKPNLQNADPTTKIYCESRYDS